jgi:uncharacterized protein YijF (DUF1287 family)
MSDSMVAVRFRAEARDSLRRVHTDSEAEFASYPMGIGAKRPGRDANHSPPSIVRSMNAWSYTSSPPHVLMARCLIN